VIKEPGTGINFAPAVNSSSAFALVLTKLHEQEESTINFAPAVNSSSAFALVLTKLHEQEESHLEPVMTN
jgi:hypothetical protein